MLVVCRKEGDEIVIGSSIRIRVIEIRGSRVKLGCEGPRDVTFRRAELAARPEAAPTLVASPALVASVGLSVADAAAGAT